MFCSFGCCRTLPFEHSTRWLTDCLSDRVSEWVSASGCKWSEHTISVQKCIRSTQNALNFNACKTIDLSFISCVVCDGDDGHLISVHTTRTLGVPTSDYLCVHKEIEIVHLSIQSRRTQPEREWETKATTTSNDIFQMRRVQRLCKKKEKKKREKNNSK